MNLGPVLDLLRTRTGLESGALGSQTVESAVRSRMKALGLSDGDGYAARLRADASEFAALLDEVVVPETWFFRGGDVFDFLAGHIRSALQTRPAFRALSLPCSTGEEPYSLAIALAERRVSGCAIDGVDISPRNLDEARRGVFGELSFRQTAPALRGRYFRAVPGGWELDPSVRPAVRFLPGNVLDPGLLPSASYDLILCRNLFIYLAPPRPATRAGEPRTPPRPRRTPRPRIRRADRPRRPPFRVDRAGGSFPLPEGCDEGRPAARRPPARAPARPPALTPAAPRRAAAGGRPTNRPRPPRRRCGEVRGSLRVVYRPAHRGGAGC